MAEESRKQKHMRQMHHIICTMKRKSFLKSILTVGIFVGEVVGTNVGSAEVVGETVG